MAVELPSFVDAFAADFAAGVPYAQLLATHITGGSRVRRAASLQTLQAISKLTPEQLQSLLRWASQQAY